MKKLFAILQTLLSCNHVPGRWKAHRDGKVSYECIRCWQWFPSGLVLNLPAPRRTQEPKPPALPVKTALERMRGADWLKEMGVAE
jgi:hypothetical protein